MHGKNKYLKFNKQINEGNINEFKVLNLQNQDEVLKSKIMNKYGLSLEESEKILNYLEEMHKKESISSISSQKSNQINAHDGNTKLNLNLESDNVKLVSFNNDSIIQKVKSDNQNDKLKETIETDNNYKESNKSNLDIKSQNSNQNKFSHNSNLSQYIHNSEANEISNKNINKIDSIIEGIIPDYNQQISIELEHVDLTFEVQTDKIDTLKEAFIKSLKRNKTKNLQIHALNDVSFRIYKGEKVGIIGYNGAGKSTLLNVIAGIYPPDNGNVVTHGKISPLLSLGAGFDYNYTGRKNILLNGAVLGYDKEYLESKIDEIIEFSELGKFIDIPIKNYSSGMLAKLGFSIATLVNPDILIIDEILGVGDVNFRKKSSDKILSLMDAGTTVLLVSHSITQIRSLCDKAIWIDKGKLREIGEVNNVCDHYLKDAEKATKEQLKNIQLR